MAMEAAHRARWGWFAAWSLPGACIALGVSQIGLVTLPLGVLLGVWLSRRSAARDSLGLVEGVGLVGVVIGLLNLDYSPCPSDRTLTLAPGQASVSCGGFDGRPWLVAGMALVALGVLSYWLVTRRAQTTD